MGLVLALISFKWVYLIWTIFTLLRVIGIVINELKFYLT